MHSDHKVRFDTRSPAFEAVAEAYRLALERADRLRRRHLRAEDAGLFSYARKIERKLVLAEAELEAAGRAITEHTRATAVGPWKQRRRPRRVEAVRVAPGALALVA